MIFSLVILNVVLWIAVSMLCISRFNDHVEGWEEWEAFPVWVKIPILLVAPALFLPWWIR